MGRAPAVNHRPGNTAACSAAGRRSPFNNSAQKMPTPLCSMAASNLRNRTMRRRRPLELCALLLALTLLPGIARAQAADDPKDEATPELPVDAPLDPSTPDVAAAKVA